jgi:hypothetical protein
VRLWESERLDRTTKLAHSRFLLTGRSHAAFAALRERCEALRHSDALKALLEEYALWTALWTGYPLYDDPSLREASTSSTQTADRTSGGSCRR